jgi:3-isopropylmalate dehydratase
MATLYDKVFESHAIPGTNLIYIDRHLLHEVTSPQAFEGLRLQGRPVKRRDLTLSTLDHNIPTSSRSHFKSISSYILLPNLWFVKEKNSRLQCETLEKNVIEFGLTHFG